MINLTVDLDQFTKGMDDLQQTQLPFATKNALNAVALDVQVAERAHLIESFKLRRPDWANRSIKIIHFATKAEPFATVAVSPPGGEARADILGKFENDTEKSAIGSHGVAVPLDPRRNKSDIIVKGQRPGAFHLHREGNRIVGDNGTYVVKLSDGRELLLQRKDLGKRAAKTAGRGTSDRATLLYLFVTHVRINPVLRFVPTADIIVNRMWATRFGEAFAQAMASAR